MKTHPSHKRRHSFVRSTLLFGAFIISADLTQLPNLIVATAQAQPSIPYGLRQPLSPDQRAWERVWQEAHRTRIKKYDPAYQDGKAIFQGKGKHANYRYCLPEKPLPNSQVAKPDKLVELNRKALKAFRGIAVGNFANQLYDCDNPASKLLAKLPPEEAGLVVYYLGREYSLRLKQQSRGGGKKARRYN